MITEIMPSAFALAGARGFTDTLDLAARVGPVRRVVVILVDGLGHALLPAAAASSPFLAGVVDGSVGRLDELQCTLPSTTPTSLVSLGTGVTPGEHGVLGFTVRVPGTDRVLTHIFWRDDPDPLTWQPVPTVFSRAVDVPSAVVLPSLFEGSGLTRAAYGGAAFVGLQRGDDLVAAIGRTLDAGSRVVFGYTAAVDTAAHRHGIASTQWAAACASTGVLLERLVATLPADVAVLVTADHGGLDVPGSSRVDLGADAELSAGVQVVAGEPRLRYLHTVPGATADVVATWSAVLGSRADVLTRESAVASGMFGPVPPTHLERIGDVVVICRGDTAVLATGHEPPEVAQLIGFHGARTHAETAVPLMSFTGSTG